MLLVLTVLTVAVLAVALYLRATPPCPCCHGRHYDRKLCYPKLLCVRCAERVPRRGWGFR
jgi:hypothetical protein